MSTSPTPGEVVKAVLSTRPDIPSSTASEESTEEYLPVDERSVTSISNVGEATNVCVILAQIVAVVIFLSCLVGAFYYAVRTGEAEYEIAHMTWNATSNYSAFFSQFSPTGRFTVTISQAGKMAEHGLHFDSYWYQDDERQQIVHKVDNATVAYVLPEATFWVRLNATGHPIGCSEEREGGYFSYIESLGLFSMEDRHSEFSRMRSAKSGYVYDSYPPSNPLFHEHGVTRGEALLVQAFVDSRTGSVLGWQTYFALSTETAHQSLRRTEYWYPKMSRATPEEKHFKRLPSICAPK